MRVCPTCFVTYPDNLIYCPQDSSKLDLLKDDPLVGTRLSDRYEIISVVGRGGMGVVYKAKHEYLDRYVAIKMLNAHLASDTRALRNFLKEAQAIARVKHNHSVTLYDFGITLAGQPFLVMDFIDGISLRSTMKQELISLPRAHQIFQQVIDALACAHSFGVIHRDLKPENIMLCEKADQKDWVEVVDFGIASLTATNIRASWQGKKDFLGSPAYMSPEQCSGMLSLDQRSDIYSLAVVVFEAISGRLPFSAKTTLEMLESHVSLVPLPLKMVGPNFAALEGLTATLAKALSKDPQQRQRSIEDFGAALKEAVSSDVIRMNSLKHRPELLTNYVPEIRQNEQLNNPNTIYPHQQYLLSLSQIISKSWQELMCRLSKGSKHKRDSKYVFLNCPHCNEQVQAGVAFCLVCGRSLAQPQNFSKIRAACGIFAYPKFQEALESSLPFLSQKARAAMIQTSRRWSQINGLLVISFLLIFSVFCAAGGINILVRTAKHLKQALIGH